MPSPNEKDFTDDALSLTSGRYALDIDDEIQALQSSTKAGEVEPPNPDEPKIAALGPALMNKFRRLMSKKTDGILGNARQPTAPQEAPVSDIRAVLDEYAKRKESPDPAEADRLMTHLETSKDLGHMLQIMGEERPDLVPRTWNEVEGSVDTAQKISKELEPLLEGTQQGLLTDVQMLGLRKLLTTVGEDTKTLANKIVDGDATPETMALYQQKFRQMEALYGYSRGQATEIARALNQQKIIAKTIDGGSLHDLAKINDLFGSPEGIAAHAALFADRANRRGMGNAFKHMFENATSITRATVEYWKNNILSGPSTHVVNVVSTSMVNVWENAVIRPTAATMGIARSKLTGNKDRVYYNEIVPVLAGSWVGLKSGIRLMAKVLKTGDSQFGLSKDEAHGEIHKLLGNKVGNAATLSFRLLRAEDELAKSIAFTQQIFTLATRDGYNKGLTGDALNVHISDLADSPTKEMYDNAMDYAQHLTFTNAEVGGIVGAMAQTAKTLVGKYPAFGFIMPFINTPANLMNYALETSILAPIAPSVYKGLKKGGPDADIALAKITTGLALSAAVYQLYATGTLTGDGPRDTAHQRLLEKATGWKKQGVLIDGTWYSIDRMDPFAASMAIVTNSLDKAAYAKNPEESEKWMMHAAYSLAEVSMDSTWLSSFSNFLEFASGDRSATKFLSSFTSGVIPYSGLVKSIKEGVDPVKRTVKLDTLSNNVSDYIENKAKSNVPGLSEYVRPARYWDGSIIIPEGGMLARMMSPIKTGTYHKPGPVDQQLISNNVIPHDPDSIVTIGPAHFSLMSLDDGIEMFYDAYVKRVGEMRTEILTELVDSPTYKEQLEGPGSHRALALQRGLASAQTAGLGAFVEEDLMPLLQQYPFIQGKMAEQIGGDPISFFQDIIEQGLEHREMPIKMLIEGVPVRSPINMPGDAPPISSKDIMPRF